MTVFPRRRSFRRLADVGDDGRGPRLGGGGRKVMRITGRERLLFDNRFAINIPSDAPTIGVLLSERTKRFGPGEQRELDIYWAVGPNPKQSAHASLPR